MKRGFSHQSHGTYHPDQPAWRWRTCGAYRTPGAAQYVGSFQQAQAEKAERAILALLDRGLPLRYVDSKVFFGKRNMDRAAMDRLIGRGVVAPVPHESTRYVRPSLATQQPPLDMAAMLARGVDNRLGAAA